MKTPRDLLILICLFGGIGALWGAAVQSADWNKMPDFRAVYSASRTLLHHRDPYNFDTLRAEYLAEGAPDPKGTKDQWTLNEGMLRCVNVPTALFLLTPLAVLPWNLARLIWGLLMVSSSFAAAFVVTRQATKYVTAPPVILVAIWLIGVGDTVLGGNLAGIVINLCVLGAWLLLNGKYPWLAVTCLAIALLLKPHDAGFVWLFFLVLPNPFRKRALQALAWVGIGIVASVLWVTSIVPGWPREMTANIERLTGPGGFNNPERPDVSLVINLQAALIAYIHDARFYKPLIWLVCGVILIVLLVKIARTPFTQRSAWIALASLAAFTMLPVYHRFYDARLLLLALPASALLWRDHKWKWAGYALNLCGMTTTSALFYVALVETMGDRSATQVLKQVQPLSLLAISVFYLWGYWRESRRTDLADSADRVRADLVIL